MERPLKIVGIVGWSGSGKTTLLTAVLPLLRAQGYRVSVIKHCHHDFDIDKPGKDSFRARAAGAGEVMLVSDRRWALMHEAEEGEDFTLDHMIDQMSAVDIVLVEGFKGWDMDKIEVHRPALGKPLLAGEDTHIRAVATDNPDLNVAQSGAVLLDINDPAAVARFIEEL